MELCLSLERKLLSEQIKPTDDTPHVISFLSEAARILCATSSDIAIWSCSMEGGDPSETF